MVRNEAEAAARQKEIMEIKSNLSYWRDIKNVMGAVSLSIFILILPVNWFLPFGIAVPITFVCFAVSFPCFGLTVLILKGPLQKATVQYEELIKIKPTYAFPAMYCPHCGKRMPESNSNFCFYCEKRLRP